MLNTKKTRNHLLFVTLCEMFDDNNSGVSAA